MWNLQCVQTRTGCMVGLGKATPKAMAVGDLEAQQQREQNPSTDPFGVLRAVLLAPSIFGTALFVASMPQVGAVNHVTCVQFMTGTMPLCALQVYLAPRNSVLGRRASFSSERPWDTGRTAAAVQLSTVYCSFLVGCIAHCASINMYSGVLSMLFICAMLVLLQPLLWAAHAQRALRFRGQPLGSHTELEDALVATGKVGATAVFIYFNVFENLGCVGMSYDVPAACVDITFANLVTVMQVAFLSLLDFALVQSGWSSYHELLTLRGLGRSKLAVVCLTATTLLGAIFIFASRGVVRYYDVAADGTSHFSKVGRVVTSTLSVLWLVTTVFCRAGARAHLRRLRRAVQAATGTGTAATKARAQQAAAIFPAASDGGGSIGTVS